MRDDTKDIILFILVAILITLCVWLVIAINQKGGECVLNPVKFYEHMKNVSCVCRETIYSKPYF